MHTVKISGSAGVALVAVIGAVSIFGLDGNTQFRGGALEEAKLLVGGYRYEVVMHCGNISKQGLGKALLKGFVGANNYQFRAWNDDSARHKAATGIRPECRKTSLYRIDRSWFNRRDRRRPI